MRGVDRKQYGARVKRRREELGWSQDRLAAESGYSQSNIDWIEKGRPKRPERSAPTLAQALGTTQQWLCYGEGPRSIGPRFLPTKELAEKYDAMPPEGKAIVTQVVEDNSENEKKAG